MPRTLKSTIAEISKEEFSDYLLPHVIFNSCKEAIVEGSKGVLEYKSHIVRVNCGRYILKFFLLSSARAEGGESICSLSF